MNRIEDLVKELAPATGTKPKTYTAEVSHTDEEGTVWVRLPGADQDTPTASASAEVKMGDIVNVEWRNNKLYIAGNYTNPSAGVERVVTVDRNAQAGIKEAKETAGDALSKANKQVQYFWTDEDGIHVTTVPKEKFLDIPTGGNALFDSDSVEFKDGETTLAEFGVEGARIGSENTANISLSPSQIGFWGAAGEKARVRFWSDDGDFPTPTYIEGSDRYGLFYRAGKHIIEVDYNNTILRPNQLRAVGVEVSYNKVSFYKRVSTNDSLVTETEYMVGADIDGKFTVQGHSSPIGDIRVRGMESDTVVHTATGTALCALTLPAGTWSLVAYVRFPSNNTGVRRANLSTDRASNALQMQLSPTQGGVTQLQVCNVVTVTATTTYYLNVYHTAGADLTLPAGTSEGYINGIRAVRIA